MTAASNRRSLPRPPPLVPRPPSPAAMPPAILSLPPDAPPPGERTARHRAALLAALKPLRAIGFLDLLVLCALPQISQESIARRTGIPQGTVNMGLKRLTHGGLVVSSDAGPGVGGQRRRYDLTAEGEALFAHLVPG